MGVRGDAYGARVPAMENLTIEKRTLKEYEFKVMLIKLQGITINEACRWIVSEQKKLMTRLRGRRWRM